MNFITPYSLRNSCLLLLTAVTLVLTSACKKQSLHSLQEYNQFLNNEENGLVKRIRKGGLVISVKYLPADYLACMEMNKLEKTTVQILDSLKAAYANNVTFQVTIESADASSNLTALLHNTATSMTDVSDNVSKLYYGMNDSFMIRGAGGNRKSLLYTLDSAPDMDRKLSFQVVFAGEAIQTNQEASLFADASFEFVFKDPFFQLGRVALSFNPNQLQNLPKLVLPQ